MRFRPSATEMIYNVREFISAQRRAGRGLSCPFCGELISAKLTSKLRLISGVWALSRIFCFQVRFLHKLFTQLSLQKYVFIFIISRIAAISRRDQRRELQLDPAGTGAAYRISPKSTPLVLFMPALLCTCGEQQRQHIWPNRAF